MSTLQALNLLKLAHIQWVRNGHIMLDTAVHLMSIGVVVSDLEDRWWAGR